MQNLKFELARELARECKSVEDVHDLLKELFKGTIFIQDKNLSTKILAQINNYRY